MIGLGIDSVEIERFAHWCAYPKKSLMRIFSETEIEYCLSSPSLSAQRFAARFAAREAFLKALSSIHPEHRFALLTVCKSLEIAHNSNGSPRLIANWGRLLPNLVSASGMACAFSLTHTQTTATAIVQIIDLKD